MSASAWKIFEQPNAVVRLARVRAALGAIVLVILAVDFDPRVYGAGMSLFYRPIAGIPAPSPGELTALRLFASFAAVAVVCGWRLSVSTKLLTGLYGALFFRSPHAFVGA